MDKYLLKHIIIDITSREHFLKKKNPNTLFEIMSAVFTQLK